MIVGIGWLLAAFHLIFDGKIPIYPTHYYLLQRVSFPATDIDVFDWHDIYQFDFPAVLSTGVRLVLAASRSCLAELDHCSGQLFLLRLVGLAVLFTDVVFQSGGLFSGPGGLGSGKTIDPARLFVGKYRLQSGPA